METISVITICFNNLEDLKLTCESVDKQLASPFEHLIIDGSSNNSINEWLNNNLQPKYRRWIFERDKGISDAFNKGVINSNGSVSNLLNSGDVYYDENVIGCISDFFNANPYVNWVSGKIEMKRGGIWVKVGVPFDKTQLFKGMRSVSHPTFFLKKGIYDRIGLFSLDEKIAMDYDLLCRMGSESYQFINQVLVRFDDKGVSTTSYLKSLQENIRVYESHFGFSIACRFWQFRLKLLYYLMGSSFGKFLFRLKNKLFN